MSFKEDIYTKSPLAIQKILVNIEGYRLENRRYNNRYQEIYQQILKQDTFSKETLEEFRFKKLITFFKQANKIPFWTKRFQQHNLDINSNKPFQELKKLPILTKQEVKDNLKDFQIGKELYKTIPTHTSGTTGGGLIFWRTIDAEKIQWATWWRYRAVHGINRGDWYGYFGGRSVVPINNTKPPFYRINNPASQILFSTYHLSKENTKYYVDVLNKRKIKWLHGYPSMLALLASYVEELQLELPYVKIVTTGAESLLPLQRSVMERVFNAKVCDHYGQAEGSANFSQCKNGYYHIDEDFSHVEFMPVENEKNIYKIIGTNWTNPAFPLIRYDTQDLVTTTNKVCSCGKLGRVITQIDGRKEDYIILPNGTKIGRLDHIFKDLVHVREAQIIQNNIEGIIINIVKGSGYDKYDEEKKLVNEARKRLGDNIDIKFNYVENLQRSKTGKLRFVISNLKEANLGIVKK